MGSNTRHADAVCVPARPHVVVAALIGLLPRLGCRLRAVEDFGMTVRFTSAEQGDGAPKVLVAGVRGEGDGSVVWVRPHDTGAPFDERAGQTAGRVLAELAARVAG